MAPLFAPADVAALVAAFPPPLPAKYQPSLVRSLSGSTLLNSAKVLDRFSELLATEHNRVKVRDLPSRLGVQTSDWLFDCYDGVIRYSKDRRSIIPEPEFSKIWEDLANQANSRLVNLYPFAADRDIAMDALHGPEYEELFDEYRILTSASKALLIASKSLISQVENDIGQAIRDESNDERVYLSQFLPNGPTKVVRSIAQAAIDRETNVSGSIEYDDEGIWFVPPGYVSQKRIPTPHEQLVSHLTSLLEAFGFCLISSGHNGADQLQQDVYARLEELHPASINGLEVVLTADGSLRGLVTQPRLASTLEELIAETRRVASRMRGRGHQAVDAELKASLLESSAKPELSSLVFDRREHNEAIKTALATAMAELDAGDNKKFVDLIQTSVIAPVRLYAKGLEGVQDSLLKEHLDAYLVDHFRREVVPTFVQIVREQDLLLNDKPRSRDMDKMKQACDEAKTFADLQGAIARFTKKQKVDLPFTSQLRAEKKRILEQKAAAMRKMSRGSDVLQNLIWILLAKERDGLFMSAGRDTTRMIKHYQSVGDRENGEQLQQWRDLLKAGQESSEDIQNMKDMATQAVQQMYETEGNEFDNNGKFR